MSKTFPMGGIHPPDTKISAAAAITPLAIPAEVVIPLGQHIGAPAEPIVKAGDKVKAGQLIAETAGFISANIHSSVSGTVKKIDDVADPCGYPKKAVYITVEGDEWAEGIDRSPTLKKEITLDRDAIVEKIKAGGIVGMGGASFPTNVKYMIPEGKTADTLVINGVECEPYLTADHRLMLEHADEMLVGVEILRIALGVEKAVIGIEENKPDAIKLLTERSAEYPGITVESLHMQYPQGAEKQLIKACTGREVPSGKLPIEVGCAVNNVGTAYAVYQMVQKNQPLVERVVTVTGKQVSNPSNFLVRVGTSYAACIEAAGGLPEDTGKVISGGPMMGMAIADLSIPVAKGTSGILMLPKAESVRPEVENCIRCGACVSVCPMGLEPYLLEKFARADKWDQAEQRASMDCMECGCCSYICPSGRPLLDYIRIAKGEINNRRRARASQ